MIKRYAIYLLLLATILQSASQSWIVAAFYWKQEYIASNLCINRFDAIPVCNGQCYLKKELKESEQQQESPFSSFKVKEIDMLIQLSSIEEVIKPVRSCRIEYTTFQDIVYSQGVPEGVFHPPQAV